MENPAISPDFRASLRMHLPGRNLKALVFAAFAVANLISATAQPYGLTTRPALGPFLNDVMPEAAPVISTNWSVVPAFPNLVFTNALGFTHVPGTNLLCVWEREGRVWFFPTNSNTTQKWLVLDISNQCQGWDDSGLLNLAFHPGFATNRHMFLYYTWVTPGTVVGSPTTRPAHTVTGKYHDRLSRFTLDGNGVSSTNSEVVFIDQTGNDTWHNGGGMFFHPTDGFLYYTDGDDFNTANHQVITNNLFAGVFRIDVDQRGGSVSHPPPRQPAQGFTANYYIPNDNPFVGQPNVLEEFFCHGLRSPHRMTIDPPTGRIYIGDVGASSREEINRMEPGESGFNFQWPYVEGFVGSMPANYIGISRSPVLDYPRSDGVAVIGGHVYRGSEFAAELGGRYLFGDNVTRTVWVMDESTTPATKLAIGTLPKGDGPNSGSDYTGLSSFGLDAQGEIHMCQMSSIGGRIYKLSRGSPSASRPLPELLSQTGAFSNLGTLEPNDGLIPYSVNSPLWSDAADKTRWMGVPTNTFVTFTTNSSWTFPSGSVFVKHFELSTNDLNPSFRRRLETRLLVRDTNGVVYGATYKWRLDHSDADLVNTLTNEPILITTATGTRTQVWSYPGRQNCLTCHTVPSGGVLGVNTRQLNGNFTYPQTGVTDNQLRALNHAGLFSTPVNEAAIPVHPKLVPVTDTNATLELRVRSYLDANCAQCHRPGGGVRANFDARFDTPLDSSGIIGGAVLDNLGITGGKVVVPGETNKSILFVRDNSVAAIKMPPLAKNTIDMDAMAVIGKWIGSLPPLTNGLPPPWQNTDLGSVGIPGDATFTSGQFTVAGSGDDIWNNADSGHFAYVTLNGDGQITARVLSVQNTDPWAKAGVMIRESLANNSTHAFAVITTGNGAAFQRRTTTGGSSATTSGPEVTAPCWVRLVRAGNTFTAFVSIDGANWTQIGNTTIAMSSQVTAGLAVTAHNNSLLNTSVFDNVSVISATPPEVTITAPTNGLVLPYGSIIPLSATATDISDTVTNVAFFRELTKLADDSSAPFAFAWSNAPAGTFALRALATDDSGVWGTSAPVSITILAPLGANAFSIKVNFQTNASPLAAGYLADAGHVFGDRGNGFSYGWDQDNTANSRQRNSANSPDSRYDTFNHLQKPGGGILWEMAVPNGPYQVRIVSGDPDFFDGTFRLNVEGALVVNGAPASSTRWVEGIDSVIVNDGRLTVSNGNGAVNNKICFIEITSLLTQPWMITSGIVSNSAFGLMLEGADGGNYVIEATTDFVTWIPVLTNTPVNNVLQFIDTSATNYPARFYRGRAQ